MGRPRRSLGRTPVRGIAAQLATAIAVLILCRPKQCLREQRNHRPGDLPSLRAPRPRRRRLHQRGLRQLRGAGDAQHVQCRVVRRCRHCALAGACCATLRRRRNTTGPTETTDWESAAAGPRRQSTTASCQLPADRRRPSTSWSCLLARRASRQRHPVMDSVPRSPSTRSSDGTSRSRRPRTMSLRWSGGCGPMSFMWLTLALCTPSSTRTSTTASGWTLSIAYGRMIWRCAVSSASCWIFSLMAAAFVLENPHHSRLWEMDEFRDLGDFPGIVECIVDSGAYGGTTVDGEPIIKPFKFPTNIPGRRYCAQQAPRRPSGCTLFQCRAEHQAIPGVSSEVGRCPLYHSFLYIKLWPLSKAQSLAWQPGTPS